MKLESLNALSESSNERLGELDKQVRDVDRRLEELGDQVRSAGLAVDAAVTTQLWEVKLALYLAVPVLAVLVAVNFYFLRKICLGLERPTASEERGTNHQSD